MSDAKPANTAPNRNMPVTTATAVRWTPDRAARLPPWPAPPLPLAIRRGLQCRCPACGQTRLFTGYLRVAESCHQCTAPLGRARADDAPPYFTIFIVGHIILLGMLILEQEYAPPLWVHFSIWLPLTAILTLVLLRPVKGATVALTLRLGLLKPDDDS